MRRRVVTVVGAGSLRCAPPVFASIAAPRFEHPLEIRLFDANRERLDLMTRLMARLVEASRTEHEVVEQPNLTLALREADAAIVCLYEDCARRMTGKTATRMLLPPDQAEARRLIDLNRGDLNSPTPIEELSPMTLAALAVPENDETRTRDEAVANALALTLERIKDARILNLTRNAPISPSVPHTAYDWPATLDPETHTSLPHRILRWINGDHELDRYLEEYRESPVARWLITDLGAL